MPYASHHAQASAIVAEARSWIGTPFHHQGRLKRHAQCKGGVDCLGLLVGVVQALQLPTHLSDRNHRAYDIPHYGHRPDGSVLHQALLQHLDAVPLAEMQAGDVLLCRFDHNPQHLGIVGDYENQQHSLIHAYAPVRKVVEHYLDALWRKRVVGVFRFPAGDDKLF